MTVTGAPATGLPPASTTRPVTVTCSASSRGALGFAGATGAAGFFWPLSFPDPWAGVSFSPRAWLAQTPRPPATRQAAATRARVIFHFAGYAAPRPPSAKAANGRRAPPAAPPSAARTVEAASAAGTEAGAALSVRTIARQPAERVRPR